MNVVEQILRDVAEIDRQRTARMKIQSMILRLAGDGEKMRREFKNIHAEAISHEHELDMLIAKYHQLKGDHMSEKYSEKMRSQIKDADMPAEVRRISRRILDSGYSESVKKPLLEQCDIKYIALTKGKSEKDVTIRDTIEHPALNLYK